MKNPMSHVDPSDSRNINLVLSLHSDLLSEKMRNFICSFTKGLLEYRVNLRLSLSFLFVCLEVVEVRNLEGLDVSTLTEYIFLGHTNINVGRLLEELRSL